MFVAFFCCPTFSIVFVRHCFPHRDLYVYIVESGCFCCGLGTPICLRLNLHVSNAQDKLHHGAGRVILTENHVEENRGIDEAPFKYIPLRAGQIGCEFIYINVQVGRVSRDLYRDSGAVRSSGEMRWRPET